MAKGDTFLAPTILTATDPVVLAGLVGAERIKRNQVNAPAQYSAVYVSRVQGKYDSSVGQGYTKYIAFVEFIVEEK